MAIAKRVGITMGELAGTVDSLNSQSGSVLAIFESDGIFLTPEGEEVVSEYRLKERMLKEQLRNLWRKPWITTDGVILLEGKLVLIRRGREPFKGMYALPGGIVEYGESLEDSVVREVREETGLETEIIGLVGTYSDPSRDPRGHFISIVYNLRPVGGALKAGDDAEGAELFSLGSLPDLAADHAAIIHDAMDRRNGRA